MSTHTQRLFRLNLLSVALLGTSLLAHAAESAQTPAEEGVSHELAISRAARVSDLRYQLQFNLAPHAPLMQGTETIRFKLVAPTHPPVAAGSGLIVDPITDLLLDYRDGTLSTAKLNGVAIATVLEAGHLRLDAERLRLGENTIELAFASNIAQAGKAITRYDDKDDGSEYIYSLFVPMDASMAFPCFDQPDLKGRFTLTVDTPVDWSVISNTTALKVKKLEFTGATPPIDSAISSFAETKPISTYLFAFAAGPFVNVHPQAGMPNFWVRKSQVKRAEPEIPIAQQTVARGIAYLADYFQQPFPFPKYEMVLLPGFPFGGMEHAGATFLREDGVLFRSAPTESDRFQREILLLHELTHQWFGDLVTMRWFDDLWLKEGFAQYMAYKAAEHLDPAQQPWKRFYETIKPAAYGIDETEGTTPIFQTVLNLKDAKSAYGAIVYQKAPALLRQLEYRLGDEHFRDGLRLYLKQHAYANATWGDLVDAFSTVSGSSLRPWAAAWIERRGMPEITVDWSCGPDHKLTALTLHQRDVLPDSFVWPMTNEVQLADVDGHRETLRVDWTTVDYAVRAATGRACPAYVFANGDDKGYGRFMLDGQSRPEVMRLLSRAAVTDGLQRSMLWGALWEGVRTATTAPVDYVSLALQTLPAEQDESLYRVQGGRVTTGLHAYMSDTQRTAQVVAAEDLFAARMTGASDIGLRIVSFRTLGAIAESGAGRQRLKDLLGGKLIVPGVTLRQLDRWTLIGRLIALNDPDAQALFDAETARDKAGDAPKYAYAVQAGAPSGATKARYFSDYLDTKSHPEDWIEQSLRSFNAWNQAALTEPYVTRALDALPAIKRDRKIFFLGGWLGAFMSGQNSVEAQAAVDAWLAAHPALDADLKLKVLENKDDLDRTVRIRQRYAR